MGEIIIVRGGGDIATGTIHRLHRSGFRVLILECERPTAIRRKVSFCEAVYDRVSQVEDVTCMRIDDLSQCESLWEDDCIPLMVDPAGESIEKLRPDMVVDAILAKKNLGTTREMAPVTVALGPGFVAGEDVTYVVETMRGHNLGRIISRGQAFPNTGIPGEIAGYSTLRVIHAPEEGVIHCEKRIGDWVERGDRIAYIGDISVIAGLTGILRGIIRNGYMVSRGLKIADIDPRREEQSNCFTISDKARCIAGSVLEIACGITR